MTVKLYRRGFVSPSWEIGGDEIVSYRVREALPARGLPLGCAASKRFTLTVKTQTGMTPAGLSGALVRVTDGGTPLGVWYVTECVMEKGGCTAVISGADALSDAFEAAFTDAPSAYPRTLGNLVNTLCAAAVTPLITEHFTNENAVLSVMPKWKDLTLRKAFSHCAFAAGCFVRVGFDGNAEMVPAGGGDTVSLSPGTCVSFAEAGGEPFAFTGIEYRFDGEDAYTRFAADGAAAPTPMNTVRASGNPLVTRQMLGAAVSALTGTVLYPGRVSWVDACLHQAGDRILFTDGGVSRAMLITSVKSRALGGGFLHEAVCALPLGGAAGRGYLTALSAFNADGTLNFEAIGEVGQKVLALDRAYIGSLTAGEISALGLTAKIIDAVKLKAEEIGASEVETDRLTAMAAEILNATVRKLSAGTVSADALSSAAANLMAAKIGALSASDISSDSLASALADFLILTAGSAEFDRATVTHLLANALSLDYGVGDKVFIKNLAADYASLISASVGSLTVKAADGKYYRLTVDENGDVTASETAVGASEQSEGVTAEGCAIIETSLTADQLSASGIRAVRALISRLDASRIDTDTLWAREAFIDRLNTCDIRANRFLRAELTSVKEETRSAQETLDTQAPLVTELMRSVTFSEEGIRQRKPGSAYSTLMDEGGYHIDRDGSVEHAGSFTGSGLTVPGVTIGSVIARRTYSGGWVFQEQEA